MVLDNDLKFLNKDLEAIMSKEFGNAKFTSQEMERQYENIRDWQMLHFERFIKSSYGEVRSPLVCKEFTEDFVDFMKNLKYTIILDEKIPTLYEMREKILKENTQRINKWVEVTYKKTDDYDDPLKKEASISLTDTQN